MHNPIHPYIPLLPPHTHTQNAADTGTILNPEGQRLKASLILLASGSIILHLAYIHTLTWWGLSLGALAMGATLMIPLVTLGVGNARLLSPANIVGVCVGCDARG